MATMLQRASADNATVRHAIITGETGEYGGNRKDTRMKLSQQWLELFGGYENETEGVKNLFTIGDGAGVTRGLLQASASGVYVARTICER